MALSKCDIDPELPLMQDCQILMAHVNSLQDFYVLRQSDMERYHYLDLTLSSVLAFGGLDLYRHADKNRRCSVAVHSYAPQKWNRLKYLRPVGDGNCEVKYIDYGNTGILSMDELKLSPPEFEDYQAMAIHCSMDILPPVGGPVWGEDLTNALRDLDGRNAPASGESGQVNQGGLLARCIRKENGVNVVELYGSSGTDWGTMLVEVGLARRAQLGPDIVARGSDGSGN